jgi:hypothetical protein
MSGPISERLYNLLPAIYRIRDAEHGEPLRALMGILQEQFDLLDKDIGGLYDDWFIETCEEWVVPYIAELLGARLLHSVKSTGVYSQRALVANTISYRRRKGTLLMLEDLARDVTGWGAHAVEFFQLLNWTQNLNHLRFEHAPNPTVRNPDRLNPNSVNRVGSVNLRSLDVVDRIDTAFDEVTHSVDIRKPAQTEGWHNIRNLGFFLWRLQSYPIAGATPQPSAEYSDGFYFSPLGNPMALFTNPQRTTDDTALSSEHNVAGPIRPLAFFQNPGRYYGCESDKSLAVYLGDQVDPAQLIPLEDIMCKDLSGWSEPPSGKVAVDVTNGRIAFAPGETPAQGITVSYHYGFSANMGGGPYDRRESIEKTTNDDWHVIVAKHQPEPAPAEWRTTIGAAISDWDPTVHSRAVITIADNATYDESFSVNLEDGQHLIIQADNRNRPLLRFLDEFEEPATLNVSGGDGENATLSLNGLLLMGAVDVAAKSLGKLEVTHCTLVPGRALDESGLPFLPDAASIEADTDNLVLEVFIDSSIVGPLRLPQHMEGLHINDSIVDSPDRGEEGPPAMGVALSQSTLGNEPGPVTTVERSTLLGSVMVKTMQLGSDSIFAKPLTASRRQEGCLRYSYVDDLISVTPRRFRCQPDLAIAHRKKQLDMEALPAAEEALLRARIRPEFTSVRYGAPGYAQLSFDAARHIKTGAQSEAEMGAFEHLQQPQREANLNIRLQEYMPYGLQAGLIFVT